MRYRARLRTTRKMKRTSSVLSTSAMRWKMQERRLREATRLTRHPKVCCNVRLKGGRKRRNAGKQSGAARVEGRSRPQWKANVAADLRVASKTSRLPQSPFL